MTDSLVNAAITALTTGDLTEGIKTLTPYAAAMVPYGNYIAPALSTLYGLVAQGNLKAGFHELYSQLTGSTVAGDISQLLPLTADPNANPQDVYDICNKLSDSIKKALAMAHEQVDPVDLPYVCDNEIPMGCTDIYVNDRKKNIQSLQGDIDKLECALSSKIERRDREERLLASCTKKLDEENQKCMGEGCNKSSGSSSGGSGCGCSKNPPPTCGCQKPPPPPPPPELTCGCQEEKPKPVRKRRQTASCGARKKQKPTLDQMVAYLKATEDGWGDDAYSPVEDYAYRSQRIPSEMVPYYGY